MISNLITGWLLGILTAVWGLAFLFWCIEREHERRNDPPTKDEWKVI